MECTLCWILNLKYSVLIWLSFRFLHVFLLPDCDCLYPAKRVGNHWITWSLHLNYGDMMDFFSYYMWWFQCLNFCTSTYRCNCMMLESRFLGRNMLWRVALFCFYNYHNKQNIFPHISCHFESPNYSCFGYSLSKRDDGIYLRFTYPPFLYYV